MCHSVIYYICYIAHAKRNMYTEKENGYFFLKRSWLSWRQKEPSVLGPDSPVYYQGIHSPYMIRPSAKTVKTLSIHQKHIHTEKSFWVYVRMHFAWITNHRCESLWNYVTNSNKFLIICMIFSSAFCRQKPLRSLRQIYIY